MFSDVVSGAALLLSLAALYFTWSQVKIADKARLAAEDQVNAAKAAVEIARKDLDRAEAPRFEVTRVSADSGGAPWIQVSMVDGPPEMDVTVSWERTVTIYDPPETYSEDDRNSRSERMVKGSMITLPQPWSRRPRDRRCRTSHQRNPLATDVSQSTSTGDGRG